MSIRNIPVYRVIIVIFCAFVHVLIKPASVYYRGNDYENGILLRAVRARDVASVVRWVELGASVNAQEQYNDLNSALMIAVEKREVDIVKILLHAGCLVNQRNRYGETALAYAVELGNIHIVRELLVAGATINVRERYGHPLLIRAALPWQGKVDIVKELLNAGALVNERNKWGDTALFIALPNSEIVKELLNANALVNERNKQGDTALILAARRRCVGAVCMLLEAGALVDIQDKSGKTALMEAASWPRVITTITQKEIKAQRDVMQSLIVAGARTDLRDTVGYTVFDVIREQKYIFRCMGIESSSIKKIICKAMKKRDRLVLQRYELVRGRLHGASVLADLVFDYEGLKELFDTLQANESNSRCSGCCLQ